MKMHVWEDVSLDTCRDVVRMKVPSGWLYYIIEYVEANSNEIQSTSLVFVPDADGSKEVSPDLSSA